MFGNKSLMPRNIGNSYAIGNTRLLLSDTPETLNSTTFPQNNGTLWHDYVCTTEKKISHRVFAWHLNNTGRDIVLGVTFQNLSTDNCASIREIKITEQNDVMQGDFMVSVGQYLAKSYLQGDFSALAIDTECATKETMLLYERTIKKGCLLGIIMEFNVEPLSAEEELAYFVRVVAGEKTTDLKTLVMPPVSKEKVHYRGSWKRGDIQCETPLYNIGEKKAYSISNGLTDNIQRSHNSYDTLCATDNPGHYGVVYKIIIPIFNHYPVAKTICIGINPRGGAYAGAVKTANTVDAIPSLNTSNRNYAKIMEFYAPPGESCAEICIMHAGAASLPVAIDIRTV